MSKKMIAQAVLIASMGAFSTISHAATLFDFVYDDKSLGKISFTLDASKPPQYFEEGEYLQYIVGNEYSFYPVTSGGGFTINIGCCDFGGAQLYTGPESMPTFLLGKYRLDEPNYGAGTLVISGDGVAAVPEPTSWAIMLAGFSIVGCAMRRRIRVSKVQFARVTT